MPSNFSFLEAEYPLLFNLGQSAELLYNQDAPSYLAKLRLFSEKLTLEQSEEHALKERKALAAFH
jgi:type I restriction enzyme R subunit